MIQKISFQNYKAFEKGEIKLKPITILLGANSVGKSSIINLLLMLQQTANSTNYKSALRLHGENVSMGECENIFRNKDTSQNIVIDFEFDSDELKDFLKKDLFDDFINHVFQPIQFLSRFPEENIKQIRQGVELKQFFNKNREINDKIYSSKETFMNLITTIETFNSSVEKSRKQSDFIRYYLKRNGGVDLNDKKNIELVYDFLSESKKTKDSLFNLSFEISNIKLNKEDVLKICRVLLINNGRQVLNIKFDLNQKNNAYKDITITSEFIAGRELLDQKAKDELLKLINFNSTLFSWAPPYNKNRDFFFRTIDDDEHSIITQIIIQIIEQYISLVKCQFTRELINHVSPLRAHPKRYYFLDKANINTVLDTLDGNSLTEILKENKIVRDKVNNWLKTFGLQVDVSTLQDVIHKLKIHQYSLDLDITDVGFGISQILPVIVQGFLSFDNSLTMIEQPEIHLHPKMQADLADLFIDVVTGTTPQNHIFFGKKQPLSKKYLLIETHSEYLLHRLRRRMSEGKISAQDVAIYFIAPPKDKNGSSEIQEKEISEDGAFEWPQDFYEGELKNDKNLFIKQLFNNRK
jgi:predicted ATPase